MAAIVRFNNVCPDLSNEGVGISISASGIVVLNKNSKVGNAEYDDPWKLENGDDANGANVVVIPTQFATYLDLYHVWSVAGGTADPTTSPTIRVYGKLKRPFTGEGDHLWPYDVNSTAFGNNVDWWKLLEDPSPPAIYDGENPYELTFGLTRQYECGLNSKLFAVSPLRKVFVGGTTEIVVPIQIASAGHTGTSMIVGHLIR